MYDSKFLLYSGDLSYKKIDKKAKDVDGNWTLLSGVIATDSAMASNNRLYNIKLQNVFNHLQEVSETPHLVHLCEQLGKYFVRSTIIRYQNFLIQRIAVSDRGQGRG